MSSYSSSQALPPGIKLGSYLIQKLLGATPHSFTYLAFDREQKRDVIVRENFPFALVTRNPQDLIVHPRNQETEKSYQQHLKKFLEQGQHLFGLEHPGITTAQSTYEALGTAYTVFPFVYGNSIELETEKRNYAGTPWTAKEILRLLRQILDALAYLHEKNILHGDISPSHLLLTQTGQPVLIGFDAHTTHRETGENSPTAPPEQKQGVSAYDVRSEVYTLAATFHKVMLGDYPGDESKSRLAENSNLVKRFPQPLLQSLDKALSLDSHDRFATAGEWLTYIRDNEAQEHFNSGLNTQTAPTTPMERTPLAKRESVEDSILDYENEDEEETPRRQRRKRNTGNKKNIVQLVKEFFLKKNDEENDR